ncbi:hypothetical protein HK405_010666 [Cladochytrium tenue]|nr:hypothetical protein HK405_010666 [Cladochytrium tenue]
MEDDDAEDDDDTDDDDENDDDGAEGARRSRPRELLCCNEGLGGGNGSGETVAAAPISFAGGLADTKAGESTAGEAGRVVEKDVEAVEDEEAKELMRGGDVFFRIDAGAGGAAA